MPERFVCTLMQKGAIKYSSFPFLPLPCLLPSGLPYDSDRIFCARLFTARSELRKVMFLAPQSVFFVCV